MAYDPNRDYAAEIKNAIASGAPKETVAQLNTERNEKIADNQPHYAAKGISGDDQYGTAAQNYINSGQQTTPAAPQVSTGQNATVSTGQAVSTVPVGAATSAQRQAVYDQLAQQAQSAVNGNRLSYADTSGMRSMLQQETDAARQQAEASVNYGVTQSVNELGRAQQDAQKQYDTQIAQIAADEARARDNQALYAAARGDRGGIAAAQYDAVANNAATNRQTVNAARIKLATDTARQIADLRAQGEFQKADAALQLTQQYLAQLRQMEQWAMEYNLSVDQFNAQMDQWLASYQLQLREMQVGEDQWERQFTYNQAVDARNFQYQQQRDAVSDRQWQASFDYGKEQDERNFQFQQQQFNEGVRQWQASFDYGKEQDALDRDYQNRVFDWQQQTDARDYASQNYWNQVNQNNINRNFQYQVDQDALNRNFTERQYADSQTAAAQQKASELVNTMLNMGIYPDDPELIRAAGMTENQARLMASTVRQAREAAAQESALDLTKKAADTQKAVNEAAKSSAAAKADTGMKLATAESMANGGIWTDNMYRTLLANGYTEADLAAIYGEDTEYQQYMRGKGKSVSTSTSRAGFQNTYQRIGNYLKAGNTATALKALDNNWSAMSYDQRRQVQNLLGQYGLTYNP